MIEAAFGRPFLFLSSESFSPLTGAFLFLSVALMTEVTPKALERHIQTVTGAVVVAALLWVGNSIRSLEQQLVRYEERMISVQASAHARDERINRLEDSNTDHSIRIDRLERVN